MTLKKLLYKLIEMLLFGIASSILAFLISLVISKVSNANLFITMSIIGIVVAVIGGLSLGHGNPIASGMINIGQENQQYANYLNMEATRMEREITNYYESAKNHAVFYFRSGGFNLFLNGAVIFIVSILLDRIF